MKFKIISTFLIVFLISKLAFTQITPEFTSNITSGCNPILVSFSDLSSGTISTYYWNFGNGNTSNKQNPKASYTDPGTYTVELTISNGNTTETITKTNYIHVFKNPEADFTTNSLKKGCVPFTPKFIDTSILGDALISKWLWDFGNGAYSLTKNPSYTFTSSGIYTISLQVEDANGCSDFITKTNFIEVFKLPKVNFTAFPDVFCDTPANVNFTNNTSSASTSICFWDFGDSSGSTAIDPLHTYNTFGDFDVKLILTDQNGCTDSLTKKNAITIEKVTADFFVDNDSVCLDKFVQFINTSTGAKSYLWTFGDGNSTTIKNPSYIYSSQGTYNVKLITTSENNCKDSTTKTIVIEKVTADFSWKPDYSCSTPFPVSFKDSSKNADNWNWYFGDGITSTDKNPVHNYNKSGKFDVKLIVSNNIGCKDSITYSEAVWVFLPTASVTADFYKGCSPLEVNFTATATSNEAITSWYWTFDDGDTSSLQNPTHVFVKDTSYNVTLTVTNSKGCTVTTGVQIKVGLKPIVDFEIGTDTACASDTISFKDLSINPSGKKNDEWEWIFGDGIHGSGEKLIHKHVDTGMMTTTLIVSYNGCKDTLVRDSSLYVYPPISTISTVYDCKKHFSTKFIHVPVGVHHWEINFGDGNKLTHLTIDSLTHQFLQAGQYKYKTIAYNDSSGCTWENEGTINIYNWDADFNAKDDKICIYDSAEFLHNPANKPIITGGAYYFGDGTYSSINQKHFYDSSGVFKVKRILSDPNGCTDSAFKYISVYQINADFIADSFICVYTKSKFTDKSTSDTTIIGWDWFLGNGENSTKQNPSSFYTIKGSFSPLLIVEDANGCVDTMQKADYIYATKPKAEFEADDYTICENYEITFTNDSEGNLLSFYWDFGNGDTSTLKDALYSYQIAGTYTISLVATDSMGCKDTFTRTNYAKVQAIPKAGFYADTTFSYCYPLLVRFTDTSISNNIKNWTWDFGDAQTASTFQNPVHNYTKPEKFDVRLIVETTYGCKDTALLKDFINIHGPLASFDLDPDTVCYGFPVKFFVLKSENVKSFNWDYGDGNIESEVNDTVKHKYYISGYFYPRLIYVDSSGTCKKFAIDTLMVSRVIADFSTYQNSKFVPATIDFTDKSSINAIEWHWIFGDEKDTFSQDATHIYKIAGNYNTMLIVTNDLGCKDTASSKINVEPLPIIIDFPTAFTPDKENNNTIEITGCGTRFKELISFRIFNRWGEIVFETTDPQQAWDGTYKGKIQNMDTYVYVIKVLGFDDEIKTEKGYITLIR
ncbi:MAG: PKD domain-containing protein [Bacteroidota bacterium]|nr:PKD domain-containing protein [Bacteroidota bacterium]